jgi:predicted RNase H-like HicB family nuclease
MMPRYSMLIRWSDEDQLFIVSLPEFGPYANTHGETYEEAARMGLEALETLVDAYQANGNALPEPVKYESSELAQTSQKQRSRGRGGARSAKKLLKVGTESSRRRARRG